jgi:hypothetical protein
MSTTQLYEVRFQVVRANPLAAQGGQTPYLYRNPVRRAFVQAASAHPKDLLTPLNNDVSLNAGESIEIVSFTVSTSGTEGAGVCLT